MGAACGEGWVQRAGKAGSVTSRNRLPNCIGRQVHAFYAYAQGTVKNTSISAARVRADFHTGVSLGRTSFKKKYFICGMLSEVVIEACDAMSSARETCQVANKSALANSSLSK